MVNEELAILKSLIICRIQLFYMQSPSTHMIYVHCKQD